MHIHMYLCSYFCTSVFNPQSITSFIVLEYISICALYSWPASRSTTEGMATMGLKASSKLPRRSRMATSERRSGANKKRRETVWAWEWLDMGKCRSLIQVKSQIYTYVYIYICIYVYVSMIIWFYRFSQYLFHSCHNTVDLGHNLAGAAFF